MGEIKYFQFPLILLKNVHKDFEQSMQDIINYAVVDFALKQQVEDLDIARQLAYNAIRGGGLTRLASTLLENMPELEEYDVAAGICNRDFEPDDFTMELIENIIEHIKSDRDIYRQAVVNCQLGKINNFFGITGPDADYRLKQYEKIKKQIDQHEQKHGKDPRPTISKGLFFDLLEQKNIEVFTMYVAIRSLEGKKQYVATNRITIAGRVAGAKSSKVLNDNADMQEVFNSYNKRYRFDKITGKLAERGLLKGILRQKNWSKFYLSTKLTPDKLGEAIAEHKIKRNTKKMSDEAMNRFKQVYNL